MGTYLKSVIKIQQFLKIKIFISYRYIKTGIRISQQSSNCVAAQELEYDPLYAKSKPQ